MNIPNDPQRPLHLAYRAYRRLAMPWQLAVFLLVALSLTWGLIAVELMRLQHMAERESKQEISNLAQAFAEEVNSSINTIDLSLIGLRAHWMRNRPTFRHIVRELQQHLAGNLSIHISIVDAEGKMTFSSVDPLVKPIDLSDREHIRVHRNGRGDRLFISEPVLGRVSKEWSIQFTRPLYTLNGRFDGVIVVSVSPAYFSRFYEQISLGEDAVITLVRQGGVIIARSSNQEQGKGMGFVLPGTQFQDTSSLFTGFYRRASYVDGVERVYAWRTLPRYGLIVMVGQSEAAILKRYSNEQKTYLLGGVGISALFAVIGFLLLSVARQRAKDADVIAESEARLKLAMEGAGDGVWDWNSRQPDLRLSRRAREILGIGAERVPGTLEALNTIVHPADMESVRSALRSHIAGPANILHIEHRTPEREGSAKWVLSRGMVVKRSADGQPLRMVGTFTDIAKRKDKEELTAHLARHDALTGLPNRTLLADRLRQALLMAKRENAKLALIYFDLDKFKPVNDTHGHGVGDLLLIEVGKRVRSLLRESDTVARIGGDEFVVLLPQISEKADAILVAENILANLNKPFTIEGKTLSISGSLGVATYPKDAQDETALMKCADEAMYLAKENGRGRVQAYGRMRAD